MGKQGEYLSGTEAILIFTHCGSRAEAETIAASLLEQQLVACASIGAAVESRYHWQGKLETATEVPLTLKTLRGNWAAVEAEIRRLHSYEVPEILAVAVEAGSVPYLAWMDEVAGKRART